MQLWETLYQPKKKVSGITSYITGELVQIYNVMYVSGIICCRESISRNWNNL